MNRFLAAGLALLMMACSSPAATEDTRRTAPEDEVRFSDVLAEFQALNTRLDSVAAPLQIYNAALCPVKERSVGLTIHTVTDYPQNLQPVAESLLGVSNRLSIRTVRAGSPADTAGLRPQDELIKVGNSYVPSGDTGQRFYKAIARDAFRNDTVTLTVRRRGAMIEANLSPETLCGYPVNVFFGEHINGHTDGEEVWVTSGLMRTVKDDVNLALIVAHEMAHAIAGHMDKRPSKALELEADRMALIMLVRAGYDIDRAIDYWRDATHPHQRNNSKTHPSIEERFANFESARASITAKQIKGEPLRF